MKKGKEKYIAFLRGINVGGHHKVPMADLRKELDKLGFENVITILNSGNIIFDTKMNNIENIEKTVSEHLENCFGFAIPTIIRKAETILKIFKSHPFQDIELTKDIRLYISLMKNEVDADLSLPWASPDKSFTILDKKDKNILSVLDLSISKTVKAMKVLEKTYGKDITTRNWNTIKRIEGKINSN